MATPTGAPVWVHTNDHATYGGDVNKRNYQGQDAVNPRTDVSAQQFARLVADVAAMGNTAAWARVTFACNDAVPAVPTIDDYSAMSGTAPTPTRNGTGDVTFTWAASYTDAYGVSGAVNIVHAEATAHGTSSADGVVEIVSPTVVRVRAFDAAGVALADATLTLTVATGPV